MYTVSIMTKDIFSSDLFAFAKSLRGEGVRVALTRPVPLDSTDGSKSFAYLDLFNHELLDIDRPDYCIIEGASLSSTRWLFNILSSIEDTTDRPLILLSPRHEWNGLTDWMLTKGSLYSGTTEILDDVIRPFDSLRAARDIILLHRQGRDILPGAI